MAVSQQFTLDEVFTYVQRRFMLCRISVRRGELDGNIHIRVTDRGDLSAEYVVSYAAERRDIVVAITDAVDCIAETFETPSHWMAL